MYNDSVKRNDDYNLVSGEPSPKTQTVFSKLEEQLRDKILQQHETIVGIHNKLHEILEHSNPNKEGKDEAQPMPSDAATRLQISINRLTENNLSLEGILKHLSEII